MATPEQRVIVELNSSHPELGRLLWMFQDTRARTQAVVDGLDQTTIDWDCPRVENTIGSLLYHIALVEADYLYADILGADYPSWLDDAFPWPDRDDQGHLSVVHGVSLAEHLSRLQRVREEFIRLVSVLTPDQMATSRVPPESGYEISPAWTLHHLMQHEAEHRGQITAIIALMRAG